MKEEYVVVIEYIDSEGNIKIDDDPFKIGDRSECIAFMETHSAKEVSWQLAPYPLDRACWRLMSGREFDHKFGVI